MCIRTYKQKTWTTTAKLVKTTMYAVLLLTGTMIKDIIYFGISLIMTENDVGKKGDNNASGLPQQCPDSVGRLSPQLLLTLIRCTKVIDE